MLLRIINLTKKFGGITAVDTCSWSVEEKTISGLIGPNGSGKTVTFDLITGIQKPDGGNIYFKGERITNLPMHKIIKKGIGRTFQLVRVFPRMTVLKNVLLAKQTKNLFQIFSPQKSSDSTTADRVKALELLEFMNLIHLKDEYAGNLSYGQQKLLSLVNASMCNPEPDLLLLDEPLAGINPTMQKKVVSFIKEIREGGKTVVIIEHEMKIIMNLCEKIVVLHHGKKIAEGPPKVIKSDSRVIKAYFGD